MSWGSASTCEEFLSWAKSSDKTIIVGNNSGGFTGYGDVFSVFTPYYHFQLNTTHTRFANGRKYEAVGISPNIYFDDKSDWMAQAIQLFKNWRKP